MVGNPVRRRFLDASAAVAARAPGGTLASDGERAPRPEDLTLLVVGGSQGARAVNDLVLAAAAVLYAEGRARLPRIVHQTGPADEARVRERYGELGLAELVDVRSFIDDMPAALTAASVVVGRAGALTLAELAMVGRPAILIPLPTAAADHQSRNAAAFARAGAAIVADQRTTSPEKLASLIKALCDDGARRAEMGRAMATLGRPDAARELVDELERVAGGATTGPEPGSRDGGVTGEAR